MNPTMADQTCLCFDLVMPILPSSEDSLLVRTSFGEQNAWRRVITALLTDTEDGFRAYVKVIDDERWSGVSWEVIRQAALDSSEHAAVLFVVDGIALEDEHPVIVVDLSGESRPPFRCIMRDLWAVDNNLNLANMDWEEFAYSADTNGIYRAI